jgi:hypothetical protein
MTNDYFAEFLVAHRIHELETTAKGRRRLRDAFHRFSSNAPRTIRSPAKPVRRSTDDDRAAA